jgi:hypothetical protein
MYPFLRKKRLPRREKDACSRFRFASRPEKKEVSSKYQKTFASSSGGRLRMVVAIV